MTVSVCVFDAYGTLFDVAAAARQVAQTTNSPALADAWPKLAEDWRNKQLQYTWHAAITGDHRDFWNITQNALDWAMEAAGFDDEGLRTQLLELYWRLDAFPEVAETLKHLKTKGCSIAILSNGTPDMLNAAAKSAGILGMFDSILSVETVRVYKPAREVYQMVPDRFGCDVENVLFVSSNGWDIAGAAHFGFRTVWVNRMKDPVDRLPLLPDQVTNDLRVIPDLA